MSARRGHCRPRCAGCGLHTTLCICALLPRLLTRTRVVLLAHKREVRRTSNTGRIALACLVNSALVVRGEPGDTEPAQLWSDGSTPALLFPARDARALDAWAEQIRTPVTLIVPDGTWGQAQRMRERIPGLRDVACVALPPGTPSAYRLRAPSRPERVSTIEAVARALGVLEGADVRTALERALTLMVERTLWMRGHINRTQVTSGLPAEARRDFPCPCEEGSGRRRPAS